MPPPAEASAARAPTSAPLHSASQRSAWRPLLASLVLLTVITGVMYPLLLYVVAVPLFPAQAHGSLATSDGRVIGSTLVGQSFARPEYFHPRPSAAGTGYDGSASGGTNLGPNSSKLLDGAEDDPATPADETFAGVHRLAADYRRDNRLDDTAIVPVDAVTRSGSGLDPDISPGNARLQARRVAQARGLLPEAVLALVERQTQARQLGLLGQPRVNVLQLNLALDALARHAAPPASGTP